MNRRYRSGRGFCHSGPFIVFACLISTLWCTVLQAETEEQQWYSVEYVLFRYTTADLNDLRYEHRLPTKQKGALHFYREDLEPEVDAQNSESQPTPTSPLHLVPLQPEQRSLTGAVAQIVRSRETELLHYRSWQMPLIENQTPVAVRIHQTLENHELLEGYFTIRRERFLHAEIDVNLSKMRGFPSTQWHTALSDYGVHDLWQLVIPVDQNYTKPASPLTEAMLPDEESTIDPAKEPGTEPETEPALAGAPAPSDPPEAQLEWLAFDPIHFISNRKLRDEELHYLDHPTLGLIVTVRRVDSPYFVQNFEDL